MPYCKRHRETFDAAYGCGLCQAEPVRQPVKFPFVKWDRNRGVVDAATDVQLLQVVAVNTSAKFRNIAGKELVNKLNTIAQSAGNGGKR